MYKTFISSVTLLSWCNSQQYTKLCTSLEINFLGEKLRVLAQKCKATALDASNSHVKHYLPTLQMWNSRDEKISSGLAKYTEDFASDVKKNSFYLTIFVCQVWLCLQCVLDYQILGYLEYRRIPTTRSLDNIVDHHHINIGASYHPAICHKNTWQSHIMIPKIIITILNLGSSSWWRLTAMCACLLWVMEISFEFTREACHPPDHWPVNFTSSSSSSPSMT